MRVFQYRRVPLWLLVYVLIWICLLVAILRVYNVYFLGALPSRQQPFTIGWLGCQSWKQPNLCFALVLQGHTFFSQDKLEFTVFLIFPKRNIDLVLITLSHIYTSTSWWLAKNFRSCMTKFAFALSQYNLTTSKRIQNLLVIHIVQNYGSIILITLWLD